VTEKGPPKFTCPFCGGQSSKVKNSRPTFSADEAEHKPEAIRRRRQCLDCGTRWSTVERVDRSSVKLKSA
jgi:transcriptional regulator NrdR family protein